MSVDFKYNEDRDVYELVAEIDGVDVPISNVPGSTVRSHVANAKGETVPQPPEQPKGAGA